MNLFDASTSSTSSLTDSPSHHTNSVLTVVTRRMVNRDGLSGEVGLASHGAQSPTKNLNFHMGLNTEENSTNWAELGFALRTT